MLDYSGIDADGFWVGEVLVEDLDGKNNGDTLGGESNLLTVYPPYAVNRSSKTVPYSFNKEDLLSIGFSDVVVKRSSKLVVLLESH